MAPGSSSLLRVRADDPDYQRRALAEAEFWRRMHPHGLEAVESMQEEGPIDRYFNRQFTGDEAVHWYETIARHGTFRHGAMLGTGSLRAEARILETNPALHLTFFDMADGALARRQERLGAHFPGRVATRVADLNFVELPPDTYDLIASSSTLHHVTNLEALAHQINRALAPGGSFFLEDYVGEPRFQFDEDKKRVYRQLFNRDRARQGGRPSDLSWLDDRDLSPFCGLRSDELLDVLRRHLDEVDVRTAGALVTPITRSRPIEDGGDSPWVSDLWTVHGSRWRFLAGLVRKWLRRRLPSQQTLLHPQFLAELFLCSDVLAAAGVLRPGLAFAIYRKKRSAA